MKSASHYIYAGALAYTLESRLLSKSSRERLLGAEDAEAAWQVLQDTYLASRLAGGGLTGIEAALADSAFYRKKQIARAAPDPEIISIIALRYDARALKTAIKGLKAGIDEESIAALAPLLGSRHPRELYFAVRDKRYGQVPDELRLAVKEAEKTDDPMKIDIVLDSGYLSAAADIAEASGSAFLKQYISLKADIFNILAALRARRSRGQSISGFFARGGLANPKQLEAEDEDSILARASRLMGEDLLKPAAAKYKQSGSFAPLEKAAEAAELDFLKQKAIDLFSPAPIFYYFARERADALFISAILRGKQAGIGEADLRDVLN